MKWYSCTKTFPSLLFLLSWLIPMLFSNAASEITLTGTHNKMIQCISKERQALLRFKQGIEVDKCGLLASWDDQEGSQLDCCQWLGIYCDNHTGHVIGLRLQGNYHLEPCLKGKISPSLGELKHLKYLSLVFNAIDRELPSFLEAELSPLDLSSPDFGGLQGESLGWLSHLTLLRHIELHGIDLSQARDWLQVISGIPFLRSLRMDLCRLSATVPSSHWHKNSSTNLRVLSLNTNHLNDSLILQWVSNLTRTSTSLVYLDLANNRIPGLIPSVFGIMHSLSYLDLSANELQGPMPSALGNIHSLAYLDLSANQVEGLVPESIFQLKLLEYLDLSHNSFQEIQLSNSLGNLCSLLELDLSYNNITSEFSSIHRIFHGCAHKSLVSLDVSHNRFWGPIPNMIGTFSSLEKVFLHHNQLNGRISPSLGQLRRLEWLDLSYNSLGGTLSNHHMSNLSRLGVLDLSNNQELIINISASWIPPFQSVAIFLRSCKLGPSFPKWLLTQKKLSYIDLSNSGIHDQIPTSFWNRNQVHLNLSHNEIYGVLPNLSITFEKPHEVWFPALFLSTVDLSSNNIEGAIPSFLASTSELLLNDNRFSGSIAPLCPKTNAALLILDLANNLLSGVLPDHCGEDFKNLLSLRLDNNSFVGKLPPSLGSLDQLQSLSLRNNGFYGEVQIPLENLTNLVILDLGYNSFTGYIPEGIGRALKSIQILDLRNNNLFGRLPSSLCQLSSLQNLDLSSNHISGTFPECICTLEAMTNSRDNFPDQHGTLVGTVYSGIDPTFMWKRKQHSFGYNGRFLRSIAISDNELQGHIPKGISCLKGLSSLILARNKLTRSIPPKIGELSLEVLDLSRNNLSGQIPSSLANMNFLSILDLSYNNLSGKIPMGTQLQGFDPSAYMGNPDLCGPPLPKCTKDTAPSNTTKVDNIDREEEHDGNDIFPGIYVSVVLGFTVGFWAVCGTLVIKRSWRHAYFRFIEDTYDRLYVLVVVTIPRVWRRPGEYPRKKVIFTCIYATLL